MTTGRGSDQRPAAIANRPATPIAYRMSTINESTPIWTNRRWSTTASASPTQTGALRPAGTRRQR